MVWLLDNSFGEHFYIVCTQSYHIPLLHFEQEHHNMGVLVLVEGELPVKLAAETWIPF